MGSCTHMPMIPIAWLSSGNFRAVIHAMTFVTCTYTDLWGMDEGISPKDKLPKLPVYPNCMCRVVPIFHGSMRVTSETPKDKTLAGGIAYIMRLTESQRHSLLGVNGAKEVQKRASWKQYARGYSDEVMQCQITNGIMQAGRPVNEQDELKQFLFIGEKKTAAEKLASVNSHYQEGREWQINCQRCVGAEAVENIVGGDKNE